MLFCKDDFVRTTVDLPDALFRKRKAVAALWRSSLKNLIVQAVEKEVNGSAANGRKIHLPLVRMPKDGKINVKGFDFDDILA